MKLKKLKRLLKEKNITYKECATLLKISEISFQRKMNNQQVFYIDEFDTLGDFIGLSGKEKTDIAFGKEDVADKIPIETDVNCSNVIDSFEKIKTLLTEIKQLKEDIFGKQGNDGISYKDVFNTIRKAND